MIAAVEAPAPAAIAPAAVTFAPPLDTRLVYHVLRVDPGQAGESRIASVRTLRFSRTVGGYVARAAMESVDVRAPARTKAALDALFLPLIGIETRMRIDLRGAAGPLVDEATSAAALRRSSAALADQIAADRAVPAEVKAMATAGLERERAHARLTASLREAVLLLLPPELPAQSPAATTGFATTIDGPVGPLPATGTITRLPDESGTERFMSLVQSAADAGDAAARTLRAQAAGLPPEAAARLEILASELAGSRFVERSTVAIDRKTGLLSAQTSTRTATDQAGHERVLAYRETRLIR